MTNGNRIGCDPHALDAVRELTASYKAEKHLSIFMLSGRAQLMAHFVVNENNEIVPRYTHGSLMSQKENLAG